MKRQVRKAVFPVAGLGTRFLPATKASPKEMLPIVDKPLIQYGVEEAVAAGVDTLVFIIGRTKNAIADHFDKAYWKRAAKAICSRLYATSCRPGWTASTFAKPRRWVWAMQCYAPGRWWATSRSR